MTILNLNIKVFSKMLPSLLKIAPGCEIGANSGSEFVVANTSAQMEKVVAK